jgi:Taurine catabolism dioxygenase TauD, TfdA family
MTATVIASVAPTRQGEAPASAVTDCGPGPIGGPVAWRSRNLRGEDFIELLNSADIDEIERAVAHTHLRSLHLLEINRESFPLLGLAGKMARLRRQLIHGRGFGYLRGLPVDRYDRETLTRIYWGLSRHIGAPVPQNRNAHMIGHVIDIGTQENDYNKRITQTSAELQFHSDPCDVVGLLCIRTAMKGGESMIVSGVAVHDELMLCRQR